MVQVQNQVRAPQIGRSSLMDALSSVQNRLTDERKATSLQQQRDIENQRAAAVLKLQTDEAARKVKQREDIQLLSQEFDAGTERFGVDNTARDARVQEVFGQNYEGLTPKDVGMTQDGTMPAVDEEMFKKQAALQAMYEQNKATQENANSAVIKEALAKGIDPKVAATLGTTLSSGLLSEAAQKKADEEAAKAYNERAKLLYGTDVKVAIQNSKNAGTSRSNNKSTGSGTSNYTKLYNDLSKGEYGSWDSSTIQDTIRKYDSKIPPQVAGELLAKYTTGDGLVTIGSKNMSWEDEKLFEQDLENYVKAKLPARYSKGNGGSRKGAPVVLPNAPSYTTAGTIASNREQDSMNDWDAQLRKIAGIGSKPRTKVTPKETKPETKKTKNVFNNVSKNDPIVKAYKSKSNTALGDLYKKDKDKFVSNLENMYKKDSNAADAVVKAMSKYSAGIFGETPEVVAKTNTLEDIGNQLSNPLISEKEVDKLVKQRDSKVLDSRLKSIVTPAKGSGDKWYNQNVNIGELIGKTGNYIGRNATELFKENPDAKPITETLLDAYKYVDQKQGELSDWGESKITQFLKSDSDKIKDRNKEVLGVLSNKGITRTQKTKELKALGLTDAQVREVLK